MRKFRWYVSQDVRDSLTDEMWDYVQDPNKSSIWSSGLLLEISRYENLCSQVLDIAELLKKARSISESAGEGPS